MSDKVEVKNGFELVVLAGARARQLLRGCAPRTTGPEKPARIAALEVKQGHVRKVPSLEAQGAGCTVQGFKVTL